MGICGSKVEESSKTNVSRQNKTNGALEKDPAKATSNVTSSTSADTKVDKLNNNGDAVADSSKSKKNQEVKVLLLGAGESGKSTIIQQLKILHQNGFTPEELLEYRSVVFKNLLDVGKQLKEARSKFNVPLEPDCSITEEDLALFNSFDASDDTVVLKTDEVTNNETQSAGGQAKENRSLSSITQFPPELTRILGTLWSLQSTQDLIDGKHRSEFYLMDSASYYMENLPRISKADYIPDEQDILRSRQKTSGIFDNVFDMGGNLKFHIYDVGGQRSERKKWIHCFDNVTLIIFCVSLSEYDQILLEDREQNRFQESLVLFDNIVNSRWFARTSVVLFLNKIDLFAEKLQKVPLETYFPDYSGGQDINKAAKYILWRFIQLNRANLSIYPHVTQATDTSNIKLVFAAIKETILENTLKDSGVL